jgi:coenzyme F420 hydrogenase subunit beta
MHHEDNVSGIVRDGLCIGCGTCAAVCPEQAIRLVDDDFFGYTVDIDEQICNRCGLCLSCCPSHDLSPYQLPATSGVEKYLGNLRGTYLGYSLDSSARFEASSGGLASELVALACEAGIVDGAIVTRMNAEKPLKAEPYLAKTADEIRAARGSKYNLSPVGLAIREILRESGKFAVVGLPCHLHAVSRATAAMPELDSKIVLRIGLFCHRTAYPAATEFMLRREGLAVSEVESVAYKGEGWPGSMRVQLKSGEMRFFYSPYYFRLYFHPPFFTPRRCFVCVDSTAQLADVSLGDAWLPQLAEIDRLGTSAITVRTDTGEALLTDACTRKRVIVQPIDPRLLTLMDLEGVSKRQNLKAWTSATKLFVRGDSPLMQDLERRTCRRAGLIAYAGATVALLSSALTRHAAFRHVLAVMPRLVLRACTMGLSWAGRRGAKLELLGPRELHTVVVFNHDSSRNYGGKALFRSVVDLIDEAYRPLRVVVWSHRRTDELRHVGLPPTVRFVDAPLRFPRKKRQAPIIMTEMSSLLVWALLYRLLSGRLPRILPTRHCREIARSLRQANVVTTRGGDNQFSDFYGILDWVISMGNLALPLLAGKRTVLLGHTILRSKNRLVRAVTPRMLRHADLVVVRDLLTLASLKQWRLQDERLAFLPDPAFTLTAAPPEKHAGAVTASATRAVAGLVTSWLAVPYVFPGYCRAEAYERYLELLTQVVHHLAVQRDHDVLLIPHSEQGAGDTKVAVDLSKRLAEPARERVKVLQEDDPRVIKNAISQLRLLVSARMHPVIHALSSAVPIVGIDYNRKLIELAQLFHLEDLVVPAIEANAELLKTKIDQALTEHAALVSRIAVRRDELVTKEAYVGILRQVAGITDSTPLDMERPSS